ncbi:MAG: hypothetical protein JWL77_6963, partial [Chthonomonadaceae bacterium]|nr:hypothetical protein [Chthonomonadaceae bacterium]
MDINHIWILLGKKITGEATPEEIAELEDHLSGRMDGIYPIRELEEMWLSGKTEKDLKSPFQVKEKWERFKSKLPQDELQPVIKPQKNINYLLLAAACILFLITIGIVLAVRNYDNSGLVTTVVQSPAGSTSEVKLPDGTKVWLNSNSKLIYKKQFGEKFREVTLVGEAFFDVVKDASHPFIVNTSSLRLKVLGTAFNVRSYTNDKTSEAALIRGSIEVTILNSPDKKITLKPTEKIIVRNPVNNTQLPVQNRQVPLMTLSNIHYQEADSLPSEAQWMERKLVFTSESFEDIAARMERYFD